MWTPYAHVGPAIYLSFRCGSRGSPEIKEEKLSQSKTGPDLPTEICAGWWENGPHWNAEP